MKVIERYENILIGKCSAQGENITLLESYEKAKKAGLDFINFEAMEPVMVSKTLQDCRALGIKKITYSGRSTDWADVLFCFTQHGCRLEGLVEIEIPFSVYGDVESVKAAVISL